MFTNLDKNQERRKSNGKEKTIKKSSQKIIKKEKKIRNKLLTFNSGKGNYVAFTAVEVYNRLTLT